MVRQADGESGFESPGATTDEALAAFAAAARIEQSTAARRRERWLRQQAAEACTLAGTCWSFAEAGVTVTITTTTGRVHVGRLQVVGEDFVAVLDGRRRQTLVALAAVVGLSAPAGSAPAGRPERSGARLAEALALLAGDRPLVRLGCLGATSLLTGELVGAGSDVVLVRPREGPTQLRYVRLSSVAELSLMASG